MNAESCVSLVSTYRTNNFSTYLDDSFCADHVCSASDTNSTALRVLCLLTGLDEGAEIAESARTICVCKHDIRASSMPHAMRDGSSLSAILLQVHDPDCAGTNICRLQTGLPRSSGCWRCFVQLVRLCELQCSCNRLIGAAVAHEQNLPASPGVGLSAGSLHVSIAAALALCAVVSILCFEVLHRFFQHAAQTILFVKCRDN